MSFPCLTDEAKSSFGETFHLKTVVWTGVLGNYYSIEVRMKSEEQHTGRQMEAKKKPVRIAKTLFTGRLWEAVCKSLVLLKTPLLP